MMRIELGGGQCPMPGFVNVDQRDDADIRHDLNVIPWPIETDSVDELYSSHCLEHLDSFYRSLQEIARICRIGAKVTLALPDPQCEVAMVHGHQGVISEVEFLNVLVHFRDIRWPDREKIPVLLHVEKRCDVTHFPRAKEFIARCFQPIYDRLQIPNPIDDQDILKWFPRTAHENVFTLEVQAWTPTRAM